MLATTTSAGRGWVWRSSATASARAAPVRPATRRQTSPSANDFASASKAGHSRSISERSKLPRGSSGAAGPSGSARRLGEIEREGLELDREVDVLEANVFGDLDPGGSEVQDRFDSGGDQLIGHGLSRFRRHRHDGDLDSPRFHLPTQITARKDRRGVDLTRDLARILVEDGGDPEALAGESLVVEQRRAEITEPDQRHRPLAIEAEDALELGLEPRDVVADPANAELAEVRQVLADLRRVQIEALGQLLRRDRLDAVLFELEQAPGVDRETADRHLGDPRQAGVGAWRHRAARRATIARGAPGPRYSLDFTKTGCPSRTAGSTR